jgi:hypothetical protein
MCRIIYFLFVQIFIFISTLYSQNPEWINYSFSKYITALEDDDNFIWAGTTTGLAKINKNSNEIILYDNSNSGLPTNNIYALAIDNSGYKWIGTNGGGLVKFDGNDWKVYDTSNSGLPNNVINALVIDTLENKWIGTANGLAKFDGNSWAVYPRLARDGELAFLIDNFGNMWIGTGGGGLVKYDGNDWINYTTSNSGLASDWIKALVKDKQGNLWIGTWGSGIAKFDGTNWNMFTTLNSGLPDNYIQALLIDNLGNKWIGTYGGGLAIFNEGGIVKVEEKNNNPIQPWKIKLLQNYPNPFNLNTIISYQLSVTSDINLKVFDVLGNEVAILVNEKKPAGYYQIEWNAAGFPSGVYFYQILAVDFIETKKLILLK